MADGDHSTRSERRVHLAVRGVFVQACVLLAPFFRNNEGNLSTSSFAMARMVSDHFPELSSAEAHIIIATVERLHRENRLQALLEN